MIGSSFRARTNDLFMEQEVLKIRDLKLGLRMINLEPRDKWRQCYNKTQIHLLNKAFACPTSTQRSLVVASVRFSEKLLDSLIMIRPDGFFKRQLKSSVLNRQY